MTVFGKLLVFFNLAFSLLLMIWALAVWTNRIDFSNTKATGDQVAGEWTKRDEVLKGLWEGVRPAEVTWRAGRDAVAAQETQQAAEWAWYHAELNHARVVTVADRDDAVFDVKKGQAYPVRVVRYAERDDDKLGVRKGLVDLDPKTKLPLMAVAKDRAGKDLQPLAFYDAELAKILGMLVEVQDKHLTQIKEAKDLTDQITGVEGGPKGLQQRVREEKQKREDLLAEEKLVTPQLINAFVESELIEKRHRQLEARKKELEKVGVAVRDR